MRMVEELGLDVYPQYTKGRKVQQLGGNRIKTYNSTLPAMGIIALLDLHLLMRKVDWRQKKRERNWFCLLLHSQMSPQ